MENKPELVRYAYLKKHNRRIEFSVWKLNNEVVANFRFKRLAGEWNKRNILSTELGLTVTTAAVIKDILQMLFTDTEFLKLADTELSELYKNKFTAETDIANK